MERRIGEIFTCNGKTYQVVEGITCEGCTLRDRCCSIRELLGPCAGSNRSDKTSVIFKEINNMEIKNNQLTIDIPEGMKIDLENSDLAKGIVRFKKKGITYDDILQAYATDFGRIRVPNHCIDKILAISQLMNIAKYYNKDWKPNWNKPAEIKYYIYYSHSNNKYQVNAASCANCNEIFFRLSSDAQAVIDNPEFEDILDTIYKK